MSFDATKLGLIIARKRKAMGLSQEKLAERSNIHRTYVSQVERGLKSPTLMVLFALAQSLEISPSDLLKEIEVEGDGGISI